MIRPSGGKLIALGFAVFLVGPTLDAHPISQSYWFIESAPGRIESRILVSLSDVASLKEISRQFPRPAEGTLEPMMPHLQAILLNNFNLKGPQETPQPRIVGFQVLSSGFAELRAFYEFDDHPSSLQLSSTFHDRLAHPHQTLCRIESDPPHEFHLDPGAHTRSVPLRKAEAYPSWWTSLLPGFICFFRTILPLAFLISLLLTVGNLQSQLVTAAIFLGVQAIAFLASESTMLDFSFARTGAALAVCYAAIENIVIAERRRRVLFPLLFGLLFGLFFSQVWSNPLPGFDLLTGAGFLTGLAAAQTLTFWGFLRLRRHGFLSSGGRVQKYVSAASLILGILFLTGVL